MLKGSSTWAEATVPIWAPLLLLMMRPAMAPRPSWPLDLDPANRQRQGAIDQDSDNCSNISP